MQRLFQTISLALLLGIGSLNIQAQDKQKIPLRDSLDGALDVSYFLASLYGFLPFAMPVTEPAVGYGVAGGLIFIHRDIETLKRGDPAPPSLLFVGGLYTENETWRPFSLCSKLPSAWAK